MSVDNQIRLQLNELTNLQNDGVSDNEIYRSWLPNAVKLVNQQGDPHLLVQLASAISQVRANIGTEEYKEYHPPAPSPLGPLSPTMEPQPDINVTVNLPYKPSKKRSMAKHMSVEAILAKKAELDDRGGSLGEYLSLLAAVFKAEEDKKLGIGDTERLRIERERLKEHIRNMPGGPAGLGEETEETERAVGGKRRPPTEEEEEHASIMRHTYEQKVPAQPVRLGEYEQKGPAQPVRLGEHEGASVHFFVYLQICQVIKALEERHGDC